MCEIFLPKKSIIGALFSFNLSDFKDGGRSQMPSVLGQLVSGEPQCTGISRSKEI